MEIPRDPWSGTLWISFVHGYENLSLHLPEAERLALWRVRDGAHTLFSYPFPRNPRDFHDLGGLLAGQRPADGLAGFKKLPRFGLTGLAAYQGNLYAGSWNGVYEIDAGSGALRRIITHPLMKDLHGICVDDGVLYTVLTCKDTVVLTDLDGAVIDHFSIQRDLSVVVDEQVERVDWRFVSKQYRGSAGYWHFNHVQKLGDALWLTARNANAFVVVDLVTRKAQLRLMNLPTPALLHDGVCYDGRYHFTSIDGKIIISEDGVASGRTQQEHVDNLHLYNRDLVSKVIRLNETAFGREPNWCRGLSRRADLLYVTVDGRYDTDLSFGVVALDEDGRYYGQHRLRWDEVGDQSEIRYVTGFDVLAG